MHKIQRTFNSRIMFSHAVASFMFLFTVYEFHKTKKKILKSIVRGFLEKFADKVIHATITVYFEGTCMFYEMITKWK